MKWTLDTVWVPGSLTRAETFLWYRPEPRLQVGLAYLWKQSAFRVLGSYVAIEETPDAPNLKIGAGLQGIGTGNPGYFATTEKNFRLPFAKLNVYAGAAFRANEDHAHWIGGASLRSGAWALGVLMDGHASNPYLTHTSGPVVLGFYLVGNERPGWLLGFRY